MKVQLANVQRFCVSDGKGIRTTVFLKGCSIRCPWCANPENLESATTYLFKESRCIKCDNNCFLNKDCPVLFNKKNFTEKDFQKCKAEAILKVGKQCSEEELYDLIIKDKDFYENGGGVTFSGGEPLLQINLIENLIKKLHQIKISVVVESCLYISRVNLKKAIELVDEFIVDMKILNSTQSKKILGISSSEYISNLKYLFKNFDKESITIRIPLNYEYTATKSNLKLIKELLVEVGAKNVEIFSIHNLAENKYLSLGEKYKKFEIVKSKDLEKIKQYLETGDIKVNIIKI